MLRILSNAVICSKLEKTGILTRAALISLIGIVLRTDFLLKVYKETKRAIASDKNNIIILGNKDNAATIAVTPKTTL